MANVKTGTLVDQFLKLHREISDAKKEFDLKIEPKKKKLEVLETELLKLFRAEKTEKIGGKIGLVTYNKAPVPTVKDWNKFYDYIHKHKSYFLLEKRVSVSAYRELLENNVNLPGVEKYERETLRPSYKQVKEK